MIDDVKIRTKAWVRERNNEGYKRNLSAGGT